MESSGAFKEENTLLEVKAVCRYIWKRMRYLKSIVMVMVLLEQGTIRTYLCCVAAASASADHDGETSTPKRFLFYFTPYSQLPLSPKPPTQR